MNIFFLRNVYWYRPFLWVQWSPKMNHLTYLPVPLAGHCQPFIPSMSCWFNTHCHGFLFHLFGIPFSLFALSGGNASGPYISIIILSLQFIPISLRMTLHSYTLHYITLNTIHYIALDVFTLGVHVLNTSLYITIHSFRYITLDHGICISKCSKSLCHEPPMLHIWHVAKTTKLCS